MDDFWGLVGLLVKSAKTPTRPCVALWVAHNAFWTLVGGPQVLVGVLVHLTKRPTRLQKSSTRAHKTPKMIHKGSQGFYRARVYYWVKICGKRAPRKLPFPLALSTRYRVDGRARVTEVLGEASRNL